MTLLGTDYHAVIKQPFGASESAACCDHCSVLQLLCSAGFLGMTPSRQMWPGTLWLVSCSGF